MKKSTHEILGSLRNYWQLRQLAQAELPCKRSGDLVDRLLGELTHFCFVVELSDKSSRNRARS